MRRALLTGLAGLMMSLLTASSAAAGQGLQVIGTSAPVDGVGRVQVVITDIAVRSDIVSGTDTFRVIPGMGSARITGTEHLPATGEPAVTVLAFDASGSFRPYWSDAFDIGEAFAGGLPTSGNVVDVVTFGTRLDHHGTPASSAAALRTSLSTAEAVGSDQRATRLKGFVRDAIAAAADRQPVGQGGARQVIVFTDGGDESDAYDVDTLVAEARDRGVRVHVVAMHADSRTSPQRLDDIKRLAELTGGLYIQGDDQADAAVQVGQLARASQGTWWLDVAFCGVPTGPEYVADTLTVEVLAGSNRAAFSDPVAFRQHASGAATEVCSAVPVAPQTDGIGSDANADVDAGGVRTPWSPWVLGGSACALATLLGLLGLLGLIALLRRRKKNEPTPVIAPVETEPTKTTAGSATASTAHGSTANMPGPAAVWRDPFETIPETHLRLIRGGKGMESFYRIHRSPFVIGGDPELAPDLVVSIPQASGRHCTIQVYKNGAVWVTDENSTNGTFVDGTRIAAGERVSLSAGQTLGITRHIEFEVVDPNQPRPPSGPSKGPDEPPAPPPSEPAPEAKKAQRNRTIYAPVKGDS